MSSGIWESVGRRRQGWGGGRRPGAPLTGTRFTGRRIPAPIADPPPPPPSPTDYLTKVVVQGKQSTTTPVSAIMTAASKLLTVPPAASVVDVMSLMTDHNIRHVPVVDGGSYLGMVSIKDVVQTMLEEHREEVGRLQEYISGGY